MSGAPSRTRFFIAPQDPPSKRGVLCAALKLFVVNGLAGTNIREIGEQAGYTNPALFKFFRSKDELALYLFERCYLRLYEAVRPAAARAPFTKALGGVVDAFVDFMDEDLDAALFVQDSLRELWPRLPGATRRRSVLGTLRGMFERGIAEGAVVGFRSPELPVAALVGLMSQFARMTYFGEIARPAARWRPDLERALAAMVRG